SHIAGFIPCRTRFASNMVFGRDSCKTEIFAHFACCRNVCRDGRGQRGDGLIQDFEQRYKVGGLVLNAQSSGFEGGLLFWLEDIDYAIAMVRRESQVGETEGMRIWMLRPVKYSQHCLPGIFPKQKDSRLFVRRAKCQQVER